MVRRVWIDGLLQLKNDKDEMIYEERREFTWEREGWEKHEEAWTWSLESWLYDIAESILKKFNENIEEYECEYEWYEYNFTKEVTLYLDKYGKTEEEDKSYILTFKILEEKIEEEEEE